MRNITLLLTIWGISLSGLAQDYSPTQESLKKKIKELKLSEQYFYAEAVVPSNISEAEQNAKDLLSIQISGILIGELNMKKKEADKLWNSVVEKCTIITVSTGILNKVFICLSKDLIFSGNVARKEITNMPIVEEKQKFNLHFHFMPDKDKIIFNQLVTFDYFNDIILFLKQKRIEHKINYGNLQTCDFLNEVYLVIFKDGKLETILGKGYEKRENLRTGTQDSIMNYIGYSIIWIQIL